MKEEELLEAATKVMLAGTSYLARGSYIIIYHDIEKNEILSDYTMCYDENDGPEQILEKIMEYIEKIYPYEVKVRRKENGTENLLP